MVDDSVTGMVPAKPARVDLIKQTEVEKILQKLEAMRSKPLKVGEEKEYGREIHRFVSNLAKLAWEDYEVSHAHLKTLSKKELLALADVFAAKALAWQCKVIGWTVAGNTVLVGIIGSLAFLVDPKIWIFSIFLPATAILLPNQSIQESRNGKFLSAYRKLKSRYGNDYFPFSDFKNYLRNQDS